MVLRKTWCEGVGWTRVDENRVHRRAFVNTLSREFRDQLLNCLLFIEDPVPWSLIAHYILGIFKNTRRRVVSFTLYPGAQGF
jgi:hypothetical protein